MVAPPWLPAAPTFTEPVPAIVLGTEKGACAITTGSQRRRFGGIMEVEVELVGIGMGPALTRREARNLSPPFGVGLPGPRPVPSTWPAARPPFVGMPARVARPVTSESTRRATRQRRGEAARHRRVRRGGAARASQNLEAEADAKRTLLAAARSNVDVYVRGVPLHGLGFLPLFLYPPGWQHLQLVMVTSSVNPGSRDRLQLVAELAPGAPPREPPESVALPAVAGSGRRGDEGHEDVAPVRGEMLDFLPADPLAPQTLVRVLLSLPVPAQVRRRTLIVRPEGKRGRHAEASIRTRVQYVGRCSAELLPQARTQALAWKDKGLVLGRADCRDFTRHVLEVAQLDDASV